MGNEIKSLSPIETNRLIISLVSLDSENAKKATKLIYFINETNELLNKMNNSKIEKIDLLYKLKEIITSKNKELEKTILSLSPDESYPKIEQLFNENKSVSN